MQLLMNLGSTETFQIQIFDEKIKTNTRIQAPI